MSGNGSFSASASDTGRIMPSSSSRSRPTVSIELLMSVSHTSPLLPTRLAQPRARSPVPPAMSSTLSPARTPEVVSVKCFHTRCRPPDIRSFITSYFCATEWNTSATLSAFSLSSTVLKPKCVCLSMFTP
ncbi:hypothetical protein D3C72_1963480 [compost metagenome]